jgi:hypothetical protein
MTALRRNVWVLGTEADPWHPVLRGYAHAIRAMQQLPLSDPRSWRYQAAIHGIANAATPAGAPWNQCQHASWYFLPWHRMYLYRFERIVRSFLPSDIDAGDWALPYWDYSSGAPGHALPPAFRTPTTPDGSTNPLFVAARRAQVNKGNPVPPAITDVSAAMAEDLFTRPGIGGSTGFGGPRTGFAHQGPAFGQVEAQPHGPVHVWVGGVGGLMTDPNTAALDPVFWLHHCNIDRLWEVWLSEPGHTNPTSASWRNRAFALRDEHGVAVSMQVDDVLDPVAQLGYTYDTQLVVAAREGTPRMPDRDRPVLVGANAEPLELDRRGGEVEIEIEGLTERVAAGDPIERVYLDLADIEGETNPGIVYGVYLNLPADAAEDAREDHLAGVVSFFGVELTTPQGAAASDEAAHAMRYSFDVTALVDRLRARGTWAPDRVRVSLQPLGEEPEPGAALGAPPPIRVGTFGLYQG